MNTKNHKNIKFQSKKTCFIDKCVKFGDNCFVEQNCKITGNTKIGNNVKILSNTTIIDCEIGDNCVIDNSYLEKSSICTNVHIGPYARLRPNSYISSECKIGNFVEIKNSKIGVGTKISHLAYVGDAIIGQKCNIGCGAIFVNYNGKIKNKITVGDNCFIGSNVNLIAPLIVNNGTYICAGTTLTQDTKEYDFVIGRTKETIKSEKAKKYLKEQ